MKTIKKAAKKYADLLIKDTSTKQKELQHEAAYLDFEAGANWYADKVSKLLKGQ